LNLACGHSFNPSSKTYQEPLPGCAEAAAELEEIASHGSAKDKLLLSHMYRNGWIVSKDNVKAVSWESSAGATPIASSSAIPGEDSEFLAFLTKIFKGREPPEPDVPGLLHMLADPRTAVQYSAAAKFQTLQAPDEAGPLLYAI